MVHKVSANIRLITPPSVEKSFKVTDDVECFVSDAICSLNVDFNCGSEAALEDFIFKCKIQSALEEWLCEHDFVKKLTQNDTFSGCRPSIHVDLDSVESSPEIVPEEAKNDDVYDDVSLTSVSPSGTPPPLMPRSSDKNSKLKQSLSYKRAIRRKTTTGKSMSPLVSTPGSSRENSPAARRRTQPIHYNTPGKSGSDFVYETVTPKMRERTLCQTSLGAIGIGARKLWSEMPQVISQQLTSKMNPKEIKVQEALFEIISTEHTYKKGLDILVTHFIASPFLSYETVLSKDNQRILFSNVQEVREICTLMCKEMEKMWRNSCMIEIKEMVDIMTEFAEKHAEPYIINMRNSVFQERKLHALKKENELFVLELKKLEQSTKSEALSLHSYLTLPMQRITRLPLLVDAVTKRVDPETDPDNYQLLIDCQNKLQQVVKQCNEEARKMANLEEMADLDKIMQFKKLKRTPIVVQGRKIVKRGDVADMMASTRSGTITLPRFLERKSESLHLILFNDLLIIAKKKKVPTATLR